MRAPHAGGGGAEASVAPNTNSSFLPILYPHVLEKGELHAVSENRASARLLRPGCISELIHIRWNLVYVPLS
jgi:hypothetical protein